LDIVTIAMLLGGMDMLGYKWVRVPASGTSHRLMGQRCRRLVDPSADPGQQINMLYKIYLFQSGRPQFEELEFKRTLPMVNQP
jgi:hypothetical protein